MTTYFYGRNSDVESFEKGSSLETPLQKCKSYAVLKDYDSLLNNSKSFRKSDEIESLEDKIENVRAELCVDTHFVRDVNKLTDFDYYKKQKVSA